MESALLCASRFVPSTIKHYGEVGAFGRNFHTSFCVQMPYSNSLLSRNKGTARRSHIVIASVLGRKVKKETIIPDPDYRLPVVLLGIAGGLVYVDNLLAAVPVGLLGLLLLVQTTRVRFVFDEEALFDRVDWMTSDNIKEEKEPKILFIVPFNAIQSIVHQTCTNRVHHIYVIKSLTMLCT
ncbi:uncharacterized protein LOC111399392 isoform X2 [Olea europaea var. sylvestris]|uniref:uncharacterized protein LOC111399392 isoform X2 n=1 Tax=Olea europaea var. sylvestris TaxID=158386 RepID=UPI000C1D5E19|nr:uncharacterized protein LOC111399392 isoform X2 [Olea europaea var. sylvestris]